MKFTSLVTAIVALFLLGSCTPAADDAGSETQGNKPIVFKLPPPEPDTLAAIYDEQCAVCHGMDMEGAAQGSSLLLDTLQGGDDIASLFSSIAEGDPARGMPAWQAILSDTLIRSLALMIREKRSRPRSENRSGRGKLPEIPTVGIATELHSYRLETVAEGLLHPYAIAPLPDGRILATERTQGLKVWSDAESRLITGTPEIYADGDASGIVYQGLGIMLDVALHPDYEDNGWIYLSYGDRCTNCNELSRTSGKPVSHIALVRGRLRDGQWVDAENIYQVDVEAYTPLTDAALGARIAFDDQGYVYLTVGPKGVSAEMRIMERIQFVRWPDGKTLRLHDDGRVPGDNPFVDRPDAVKAVWTLGHRTPQGLAFDFDAGLLWQTEHGPRGGDELNLILPGRNYGWPMTSLGMNYDGTPVVDRQQLAMTPEDLTSPVYHWTPSIAVSSIDFYRGEMFPLWANHLLVASLVRNELIRLQIDAREVVHSEVLLRNLSRIRDVAVAQDGAVYLILEHRELSRIVRMSVAAASEA